jgi:hypothetical protein
MDAAMIPRSAMTWFLAFLLAVMMIALTTIAQAKPTHIAQEGNITITITDEKCALSAVSMPFRATWKEGDKHYEGCVGQHPTGILIFYFTDGSIVLMATQVFRTVTGV